MGQTRYEEIRKIQVRRLASVLAGVNEESAKRLCEKVEEKVESFANGDLDHAVDATVLLWKLSREDTRPPTTSTGRVRLLISPSLIY